MLSRCAFFTPRLSLKKQKQLIVQAYLKSVIMPQQPFHLTELISPLVFCLPFSGKWFLYESCSLEIVKSCNSSDTLLPPSFYDDHAGL